MREIRLNGLYIGAGLVCVLALVLVGRAFSASLAVEPTPLPADLGFGPALASRPPSAGPDPRMIARWGPRRRRQPVGEKDHPRGGRHHPAAPSPALPDSPAPPVDPAPRVRSDPVPAPAPPPRPAAPTPAPPAPSPRAPPPPAPDPSLPRDGSEEFAPH